MESAKPSGLLIEEAQKDVKVAYQLWSDFAEQQAKTVISRYEAFSDIVREEILIEIEDKLVNNLPTLREHQKSYPRYIGPQSPEGDLAILPSARLGRITRWQDYSCGYRRDGRGYPEPSRASIRWRYRYLSTGVPNFA